MGKSTIMLSKSFNIKYLSDNFYVQYKLDGVAALFTRDSDGCWSVQSRQGKPILSVQHILDDLNNAVCVGEVQLIGELTVQDVTAFKDASGIIRRHEENQKIHLNIFDYYKPSFTEVSYEERYNHLESFFRNSFSANPTHFSIVKNEYNQDLTTLTGDLSERKQFFIDTLITNTSTYGLPDGIEGFMLKNKDGLYKANKRSWDNMKLKPKPTWDLQVIRYEEATANKRKLDEEGNEQLTSFLGEEYKEGEGLNCVGRIVCDFKGEEIGVGAGNMTHQERRDLWIQYMEHIGHGGLPEKFNKIIEVGGMLDESYSSIRQPIFKRFRDDKTEPSYEA